MRYNCLYDPDLAEFRRFYVYDELIEATRDHFTFFGHECLTQSKVMVIQRTMTPGQSPMDVKNFPGKYL